MILLKSCPRCHGDMMLEKLPGDADFVCLQCGYRSAAIEQTDTVPRRSRFAYGTPPKSRERREDHTGAQMTGGVAAGVPYVALRPATAIDRAPVVVVYHMMNPPRSERAMADEPGIDPAPQSAGAARVDSEVTGWLARHLRRPQR